MADPDTEDNLNDKDLMVKVFESFRAEMLRLEARIDQLEQQNAALTTGFMDLTTIVDSMVEHFHLKDDEDFGALLYSHKQKMLEILRQGIKDAETSANKFVSPIL